MLIFLLFPILLTAHADSFDIQEKLDAARKELRVLEIDHGQSNHRFWIESRNKAQTEMLSAQAEVDKYKIEADSAKALIKKRLMDVASLGLKQGYQGSWTDAFSKCVGRMFSETPHKQVSDTECSSRAREAYVDCKLRSSDKNCAVEKKVMDFKFSTEELKSAALWNDQVPKLNLLAQKKNWFEEMTKNSMGDEKKIVEIEAKLIIQKELVRDLEESLKKAVASESESANPTSADPCNNLISKVIDTVVSVHGENNKKAIITPPVLVLNADHSISHQPSSDYDPQDKDEKLNKMLKTKINTQKEITDVSSEIKKEFSSVDLSSDHKMEIYKIKSSHKRYYTYPDRYQRLEDKEFESKVFVLYKGNKIVGVKDTRYKNDKGRTLVFNHNPQCELSSTDDKKYSKRSHCDDLFKLMGGSRNPVRYVNKENDENRSSCYSTLNEQSQFNGQITCQGSSTSRANPHYISQAAWKAGIKENIFKILTKVSVDLKDSCNGPLIKPDHDRSEGVKKVLERCEINFDQLQYGFHLNKLYTSCSIYAPFYENKAKASVQPTQTSNRSSAQ